jgi:hypothetical protein
VIVDSVVVCDSQSFPVKPFLHAHRKFLSSPGTSKQLPLPEHAWPAQKHFVPFENRLSAFGFGPVQLQSLAAGASWSVVLQAYSRFSVIPSCPHDDDTTCHAPLNHANGQHAPSVFLVLAAGMTPVHPQPLAALQKYSRFSVTPSGPQKTEIGFHPVVAHGVAQHGPASALRTVLGFAPLQSQPLTAVQMATCCSVMPPGPHADDTGCHPLRDQAVSAQHLRPSPCPTP